MSTTSGRRCVALLALGLGLTAPAWAQGEALDAGAPPPVPNPEPQADADHGVTAHLAASARVSAQGSTAFLLDSLGTEAQVTPVLTRLRVAPEIHWRGLGLVAEADVVTGAWVGIPSVAQVGQRVPYPPLQPYELRRAFLEYQWGSGFVRVGQLVPEWGLGMLSNSAAKDPEAGDFGQRQYGPLMYRAVVFTRPFASRDDGWQRLEASLAFDLVARDTSADYQQGDRALQACVALRWLRDPEHHVGLNVVLRNQRNITLQDDARATNVLVVDAAGRWAVALPGAQTLTVGLEVGGVTGTTSLYPSATAAVLQVRQFGGVARTAWKVGRLTFFLDGGYASGDANSSDARAEALRFDRDYKVGLLLFDQVLAYQSARTTARLTAASPTGTTPPGAQWLGTGGSVTGATYGFPRAKFAFTDWLDGYGGVLLAFTTAPLADPLETRLAGGVAHNALGGTPGPFLGTEVDLGGQARFVPARDVALQVTLEGAVLVPGSALTLPSGRLLAPVWMGRVRLGVAL